MAFSRASAETDADRAPPRRHVARRDEGGLDAEARQGVGEEVMGAAVQARRGDDVSSPSHERDDGQVQRRLPACRGDGADAILQRGYALLEDRDSGIRKAGVHMAGRLHVEEGGRGVGIRKDVGSRLVDRHGPGTGGRVGRLAGMDRQSVRMRGFGAGMSHQNQLFRM